MKRIIFAVAACVAILTLSAQDRIDIVLNGGKLTPVDLTMVESSPYHLNFCFATRFSDGTIYLNHSTGVHTVTERGCRELSPDNGRTWRRTETPIQGMNSFETRDGLRRNVACWNPRIGKAHDFTVRTYSKENELIDTRTFRMEYPAPIQGLLHRDVRRTADGRLLTTGYGRTEGAKKFLCYLLASDDDGFTWQYLSTIAEDPAGETPEGPCEPGLEVLDNGDILAVYRTGSIAPMYQKRSTDGGRSWGPAVRIAPYDASPSLLKLADGTLVIVAGRPKLYLMVDFSGTGNEWQSAVLYDSPATSSYASVLETAPGELLVVYDESDFGSWRNPSHFHRIMAARYRLIRDDALKAPTVADPRAERYDVFYSPASRRTPDELRLAAAASGLKPKRLAGPNDASFELVEIAERSHPVLRVVSRSEVEPGKFANFSGGALPEQTRKLKIDFEIRLGDAGAKTDQFMVSGRVGSGAAAGYAWITFGLDGIHHIDAGKRLKTPFEMGTDFHAFELELDGGAGSYVLYAGRERKRVAAGRLTKSNVTPKVLFGDGSGLVAGSFDLSYIGWKAD